MKKKKKNLLRKPDDSRKEREILFERCKVCRHSNWILIFIVALTSSINTMLLLLPQMMLSQKNKSKKLNLLVNDHPSGYHTIVSLFFEAFFLCCPLPALLYFLAEEKFFSSLKWILRRKIDYYQSNTHLWSRRNHYTSCCWTESMESMERASWGEETKEKKIHRKWNMKPL